MVVAMSALARTLQILLMVAGLGFFIVAFNEKDGAGTSLEWSCTPNGTSTTRCTGSADTGEHRPSATTYGIIGLGCLVASVSVAAGAKRRTPREPAPPVAAPPLPGGPWPGPAAPPPPGPHYTPAGWPPGGS
jgi:hypothetical protein